MGKLLKASKNLDNPRVENVRVAAVQLREPALSRWYKVDEIVLGKIK